MTQEELNRELLHAVRNNDIEKAKKNFLLGADANATGDYGITALMYACGCGFINMAQLLIEHGADINIALMRAAWTGYIKIMKLLIEHGADINIKNNEGQTALDILKARHPNKYNKLIEYKARKEQLDTEDSLTRQDVLPDWNI